jgi:hypothetical protein
MKIPRYRIVEVCDGYTKQWFRPQRKGWLFWRCLYRVVTPYDYKVVEFKTIEEAKQRIAECVHAKKQSMREYSITHTIDPTLAEVMAMEIMHAERDKEEAEYRAKSNVGIKTLMEELPPKIGTTTDDLVGDPEDVS